MKMTVRTLSILPIAAIASACNPLTKVDMKGLLTGGRDGWQHPARVVEAMAIEAGDRVAEVGAGNGYWIPWLSEAVGPTGIVHAVEVEEERIRKLEAFRERKGLDNVVIVKGGYDDPNLPDSGVDLVMTCLTYHHIGDRERYFRGLHAVLAAEGRVVHLDDRHDTPPPIRWIQRGHVSDADEIVREMKRAGYRLEASWDFLPVQSFQSFRRIDP